MLSLAANFVIVEYTEVPSKYFKEQSCSGAFKKVTHVSSSR